MKSLKVQKTVSIMCLVHYLCIQYAKPWPYYIVISDLAVVNLFMH